MFFDIGWQEIALIGGVALVVIGPKELPGALRTAGQWVGKARRMAQDFQSQFQEALREADVAEMKRQFDEAANAAQNAPTNLLGSTASEVKEALALEAPAGSPPAESTAAAAPAQLDAPEQHAAPASDETARPAAPAAGEHP